MGHNSNEKNFLPVKYRNYFFDPGVAQDKQIPIFIRLNN
jgi:hypothetical protein